MVKVGAIIQVRLGSERLPNKAFLPLPFGSGPSLLEHVISRAKSAIGVHEVIVATTDKSIDDPIYTFCEVNNLNCFRGSENDVLDRFVKASEQYDLDIVIRLTGDNPFISPDTITAAVQQHLSGKVDYTLTEGLPLGTNIEVVSYNALKRASIETIVQSDLEHVTPYIRRNESFKKQIIKYDSPVQNLRLTIDYPSDYALASLIYEKLHHEGRIFGLEEVEMLILQNPWLKAVNSHNSQRVAFSSEEEELQEALKILKSGGCTRVLEKLQKLTK
jgi:spore coat polysaccharide biosynthesis protein SpsF